MNAKILFFIRYTYKFDKVFHSYLLIEKQLFI